MSKKIFKWMNRLFPLALIIIVGGVIFYGHHLWQSQDIQSFAQFKDSLQANLTNAIENSGAWAPIIFMIVYFIITLLFISAALFTILSGVLFGPVWGSIYVIIAATLSAQAAFYITRGLGQKGVEKFSQKPGFKTLFAKLEDACRKNGFRNFFVMRCLFLPYILMSYAAGMIKSAKAKDFFFATLFANMIFSPAFVFFGDSLMKGPKALLLPVALIACVLLVPKLLKRFSPNKEQYDLIIIGGGSGGLSLASGAAQLGVKTLLVDKELFGGDCLHYGCVPSKALIKSAKIAHYMREAGKFWF